MYSVPNPQTGANAAEKNEIEKETVCKIVRLRTYIADSLFLIHNKTIISIDSTA